jgi:hypothetical protein
MAEPIIGWDLAAQGLRSEWFDVDGARVHVRVTACPSLPMLPS